MLDTHTIHIVVGLVSVISTLVMAALWRINSRLPGVIWWFGSSLCTTLGFGLLAGYGGDVQSSAAALTYAISNALGLWAWLLMLEGTLRFRRSVSAYRWRWLLAVAVLVAVTSWFCQSSVILTVLVHDPLAIAMLIAMAVMFVWRTSRHEIITHGMAAFFLVLVAATLITRWLLAIGASNDAAMLANPLNNVLLLGFVIFTLGWTYSVSLACFYRSQNTILRFARQDALTHLPNRRDIDETLQRAIGQASRTGGGFGWILMDLNGFKPVNDKYGHAVGDAMLVEVARRLRKFCRESDFAGRLGGDEFVVLVHGTENADQLRGAMQRLARGINGPAEIAGISLRIDASMGAALWPRDGRTARKLTMVADKRMYASKERRGSSR